MTVYKRINDTDCDAFSNWFHQLLVIVIFGKPGELLLSQEKIFLNLPRIAYLWRILCREYEAEFLLIDHSPFKRNQSYIKAELAKCINILKLFKSGVNTIAMLDQASQYLAHDGLAPNEPVSLCKKTTEKLDRARALFARTWRVLNQLLLTTFHDTDTRNKLITVTTVFLYLAWVFPAMRLLMTFYSAGKHVLGYGCSDTEKSFSMMLRLTAQLKQHKKSFLNDAFRAAVRLLGCFLFASKPTQVTFTLFSLELLQNGLFAKQEYTATKKTLAMLDTVLTQNEIESDGIAFFKRAFENGCNESRAFSYFKVVVSFCYVMGLGLSLYAILGEMEKKQSLALSITGAFMVALTCIVQTARIGSYSHGLFVGAEKKMLLNKGNRSLHPAMMI